jgi:hypothetical protein
MARLINRRLTREFRITDPRTQEPTPRGRRFEATVEELPDDSTRKVTPDKPAEDKNREGSYEKLMGLVGGLGSGGTVSGP